MKKKFDKNGRELRKGEKERADGLYEYRFPDPVSGKRLSVYRRNLADLRDEEARIQARIVAGLPALGEVMSPTVNELFRRNLEIRELKPQTRHNYEALWKQWVENGIGKMRSGMVKPSEIKSLYARMSKAGYSHATIKTIHLMLSSAFEVAFDDDLISKNPCKKALGNYGTPAKEKQALSVEDQQRFLEFVKNDRIYRVHLPMITFMLGTACRCGEVIGLTWQDVDFEDKVIHIDHQLIYKNLGEGVGFHIMVPKTHSGIRTLPLTDDLRCALVEQKKYQFQMGIPRDYEVDGKKNFIFTAKTGRPLQPSAVNNILYNIVRAFNIEDARKAKATHQRPRPLPYFSAHILRHTGCTRMAEAGIDVKVLQYLMGHSDYLITMNIYSHITDKKRIDDEMKKLYNSVKLG